MIQNTETKVIYDGDGVTKKFPITFVYNSAEDIRVRIADTESGVEQEVTRDYYVDTVAGLLEYPGYPPGQEPPEGEQPPILPEGKKIVVYRKTPRDQLNDMGGQYPLPALERMADKLTMIVQEMQEEVDRSIKIGMTDDEKTGDIVETVMNAAKEAEESAAEAEDSAKRAEAEAVIDKESTVNFTIGCDEKGVYMRFEEGADEA